MNMVKFNLTPKEKHILGSYILKHCALVEGKDFARWDEEGGSDLMAADKLKPQIPKVTVFHVRYLRQKFDLPIKKHEEHITVLEALSDKVEALTVRLREYETRLQTLEDKYTAPKR